MAGAFPLRSGSRIAIVGGGPAGSFFAHFAKKQAEKNGLDVAVVIFDGKDFLQRGPGGCNLCAGVISASLEAKLRQEGLFLPEERIINRIDGYSLHIDAETLRLSCVDNGNRSIATVFRGNGPRYSHFPQVISFDDFLLNSAQEHGTKVISKPVWEILLPQKPTERVALLYGEKRPFEHYEADLVVGAFGVNTHLFKIVEGLGIHYRPPSTLKTFQAEFRLGRSEIEKHFRNDIHVYLLRSKTIRYATIIPKGDYVTVSIIGKKDASPELASEFFARREIRSLFPPSKPQCLCFPKIAVSAARNPLSDRLVLIGDASFSRHYKNGIESAFLTAMLAAAAAFGRGVDTASLRRAFYRPAKKLIVRDNIYGRILIRLNDVLTSVPFLSQAHFSLASKNGRSAAAKKLRQVLWSMFTGEIPYRAIFSLTLDFRLQMALSLNTISHLVRKMKDVLAGKAPR